MATVEFRYDPKNTAWFTANAAMVLKAGEPAYHDTTGLFKLGDGVTALSALSFLPTVSASTPTIQQVLTAGQVATTTIETTGFIKTGGLSTQFLKADGSVDSSTYLTTLGTAATSLTTTGSSGAATLIANVLNVPNYTLAGLGGTTLAAVNAQNLSVFAATTSSQLAGVISDETGSGALVFGTSPTFTTNITTPNILGTGGALTITAKTTLLDEMYLGASAIYGIWSWNAGGVILKSGSSAVNFTIGTPAYSTNLVSYNATGNIAIGGVTDNTLDQLQVSNTIGTPTLNLRGRSGAAPTVINFIPFDATNSVINFRTSGGTIRGFIDLNIASGEMKFWGSSGGYFPTFGSNGSERMRIDVNGNIICGTAAIATNATNGFFYAPTCAGLPTGVPTTVTGRVPVVVDSTNNKIYIYSSGSWITSSSTGYTKSVNNIAINTTGGATANTDYYYFCTATLTLTLPTAVGNTNTYYIKVTSGTLTINTTSSQTIDGSLTIVTSVANTAFTLISDGTNWQII